MLAIVSLLLVISISILLTRIATIALTHTGLSRETARFQARSAFTGAGFTTEESEKVVTHPVRRRIVLLLMLVGNAGIVTSISSLMLTFVGAERSKDVVWKVVLIAVGIAVLWTAAASSWVDRHLSRWIETMLKRHTRLDVKDYAGLLRIAGGYELAELLVRESDWIAGKRLQDARLSEEGLVLLGVQRTDGSYLGAPQGDTEIRAGDTLYLYGRSRAIASLDEREVGLEGDREHRVAQRVQRRVAREEAAEDRARQERDDPDA